MALAMVEARVVANGRTATAVLMVGAYLLAAAGAGCGRETTVVTPPPPEVSVSQPIEEPVQETLEFTGRISAVESVEVRARVTGYITKVAFTDGALVKAGDLLFEIDPREYQAAVLRAEGQVARLRAQLARAESEVARNQALRPSGAASARELERSVAERGAAEGELKTTLGQLETARLDLEFTRVTAPIAGRVSRAEVTQGNLVIVGTTGGPLLTTIVSLDPINVDFDADERALVRFRKSTIAQDGAATPENVRAAAVPALVALAEEKDFPHRGTIDFVDNQVDPSTGTIRVRAVLPNPNGLLTPGLFVRVRVPVSQARPSRPGDGSRHRHGPGQEVRPRRERPERGRVSAGAARRNARRAPGGDRGPHARRMGDRKRHPARTSGGHRDATEGEHAPGPTRRGRAGEGGVVGSVDVRALLHRPARSSPRCSRSSSSSSAAWPCTTLPDRAVPGGRAADDPGLGDAIPGASAKVVADTVATPIEQEVNGVENMLYMSLARAPTTARCTSTSPSSSAPNLNMAQVLVQNRVSIAEAKLPEEVKRQGVTTKKKSPSILLCVNLISPDNRYDQLYLSNYATHPGEGRAGPPARASAT